jgi:cyclophilin family peptidyl-prolyl cis-trans isomerase/HEAT repeat protein
MDSVDNLTGGSGMRCDGWVCKEVVREFLRVGGIFCSGGGPQPEAGHRCRPIRTIPLAAALSVCVLGAPVGALAQSRPYAPPQASVPRLAAMAAEEDSRGQAGLTTITAAMTDTDPQYRRVALRALGRLQSARHAEAILSALNDSDSSVRVEAATALGQSMQALRGSAEGAVTIRRAMETLLSRATADPAIRGVAARTLGRLPYADSTQARRAESSILTLLGGGTAASLVQSQPVARLQDALHGLYALARARRSLGTPSRDAVAVMRSATTYKGTVLSTSRGGSTDAESAARVRRIAFLGLAAAGAASIDVVQLALGDGDEQVRRWAMTAQRALADTARRVPLVRQGLRDPSPLVRHEAVRSWGGLVPRHGCGPLLAAIDDANIHVTLAAIDALNAACEESSRSTDRLVNLIEADRASARSPSVARGRWQRRAHALVAMARIAPRRAAAIVRRDANADVPGVRVYALRAAAILRDTLTLIAGTRDTYGNVREAALTGLASVVGHAADSVFVRSLAATDYHVVLEAATALKGSPLRDMLMTPLLAALDRITAEQRETSRDPRLALLERISEVGSARYAARLGPYRADFDSSVAQRAATILTTWGGQAVRAEPRPLERPREAIDELMAGEWRARVTMSSASGGGTFELLLFSREAPHTVARFVRLARRGYYNGLTFHRVEPGFVIQGGSPAATEYVGDGPFMRDELGSRSHTRGTLGISTRGRDTGDAQIFVNLIDNYRLDHDYTVFGEILRGRDVAEGVLEGDVIARVEIVRSP